MYIILYPIGAESTNEEIIQNKSGLKFWIRRNEEIAIQQSTTAATNTIINIDNVLPVIRKQLLYAATSRVLSHTKRFPETTSVFLDANFHRYRNVV